MERERSYQFTNDPSSSKIFSLSIKLTRQPQPKPKLVSKFCHKQNVKQLLQSQVNLFNKVPGPFKIFQTSSKTNQILNQEPNTDNTIRSYNLAHCIHIVLFALKVLCAFDTAFRNDGKISGDLLTGYITWWVVFSLGHFMFLFIRQKHSHFVLLINTLFTLQPIQNSQAVKLVVWNTPFVYIFANIFFLILLFVADIDPINIWSHLHLLQKWSYVYTFQKYFFLIYNTWNFSLVQV